MQHAPRGERSTPQRSAHSLSPTEQFKLDRVTESLAALGYRVAPDDLDPKQNNVFSPTGAKLVYCNGVFVLNAIATMLQYDRATRGAQR